MHYADATPLFRRFEYHGLFRYFAAVSLVAFAGFISAISSADTPLRRASAAAAARRYAIAILYYAS